MRMGLDIDHLPAAFTVNSVIGLLAAGIKQFHEHGSASLQSRRSDYSALRHCCSECMAEKVAHNSSALIHHATFPFFHASPSTAITAVA